MRWSAIARAHGGLGACLGVALNTAPGPAAAQPAAAGLQPAPQQQELAIHPVVDQRDVLALEPARAPALLGAQAFEHVRTLVGFGPRYTGSPAGRSRSTTSSPS